MPKRFNIDGPAAPPAPQAAPLAPPPAPTAYAPPPPSFDPRFTGTAPAVSGGQELVVSSGATVNHNLVQLTGVPGKALTMEEIGTFGQRAQGQLATVTDKITGVAKTSDMDEVGKLLTDTIMAAKGFDPSNLFKGGFLGFFKAKGAQLQMKFDTVDQTVNRLVGQIDQRIGLFRGRIRDLEQLAIQNKAFHDSLDGEIEAVNARADWMEANIPEVDPADPMSATARQQWITVINFARKRADDLRRAQVLAQQQQAQIGLMADNSGALAMKFADIKVTTIPSLKQTFTLYILNLEQKKGAEFATQIDDMTDETLKKNAALLGQNTVLINTALTRSNVSIEALQANHDAVIKSLEDVERIRNDMKVRLASEAPKLEQLSSDLTKRLAQK
ncbi:MAG: hypothetical protein DI537_46300 [Stutzerimonas stutzeri]|nr:MAG: hypothetical protein DI537_46300 [Stutzerimonas stutzeri]